jgi:hypothetical protein
MEGPNIYGHLEQGHYSAYGGGDEAEQLRIEADMIEDGLHLGEIIIEGPPAAPPDVSIYGTPKYVSGNPNVNGGVNDHVLDNLAFVEGIEGHGLDNLFEIAMDPKTYIPSGRVLTTPLNVSAWENYNPITQAGKEMYAQGLVDRQELVDQISAHEPKLLRAWFAVKEGYYYIDEMEDPTLHLIPMETGGTKEIMWSQFMETNYITDILDLDEEQAAVVQTLTVNEHL